MARKDGELDAVVMAEETLAQLAGNSDGDTEADGDRDPNPKRLTMRRLRDVAKVGLGWETSAVTPKPFTDEYVFYVKTPTGNTRTIDSVRAFATAVEIEEYLSKVDADPEYAAAAKARSEFYDRYKHSPSLEQEKHFRATGEYLKTF